MKITLTFHAKTLLALSTLTDPDRPNIAGVNIRRKEDSPLVELHATNGHVLGIVILDPESAHENTRLTAEGDAGAFDVTLLVHDYMTVLKAAAKAERKKPESARHVVLTIDTEAKACIVSNEYTGLSLSRPLFDGMYPTVDAVKPKEEAFSPVEKIGFTPTVLKAVAGFFDAMPEPSGGLAFRFTTGEGPALVKGFGASMIIMPCRI